MQRVGKTMAMPSEQTCLVVLAISLSVWHGTVQAAHPLLTDDTETQGTHHSQIEINTDRAVDNGDYTQVGHLTYAYGFSERVDIDLNMPSSLSSPTGFNDAAIGFKWRFADKNGVSFAVVPTLALPTANQGNGLGNGKYNPGITLNGSYIKGSWTWLANIGAVSNRFRLQEFRDSNRAVVRRASAAVIYAANAKWQLAADSGISQNPSRLDNSDLAYFLIGAIYSPNKTIDLDAGIKFGLTGASPSRGLGAGLTLHY